MVCNSNNPDCKRVFFFFFFTEAHLWGWAKLSKAFIETFAYMIRCTSVVHTCALKLHILMERKYKSEAALQLQLQMVTVTDDYIYRWQKVTVRFHRNQWNFGAVEVAERRLVEKLGLKIVWTWTASTLTCRTVIKKLRSYIDTAATFLFV